ncbi:FkbM family methyltransferase [Pedobacter yonginense]|uniref:FkbM family methyltransferase n=1 Tax=Pedobacter yonginense TaxID=651869 RepID=UPI0014041B76|nr:FkbM family methyltransferase [Pedobacter yonginense]
MIHSRFLVEKLYGLKAKVKKAPNGFIVEDFEGISSFIRKNSSDGYVFKQIFLDQEYAPLVKLLKKNNIKVNTIIDCGANVGYTTTYLKNAFPAAKIYCVEPDVENLACAAKNTELNALHATTLINKGIWGKNAFLKITKDFRDGESWSLALVEVALEKDADVYAITIAQLMKEYQITEIDVLKIDIEGAERYLFEDEADASFFLSKTKCIAIEIHDEFNSREMIMITLVKHGFTLQQSGELILACK